MALWSLFGKRPLTPAKIEKIAALAANSYAQPDVRMREMQRLVADGSAAALRGVLKRFSVNASGHIADEEEKKWLEDALVDMGESALDPLRDYIRSQDGLTFALRAFRRIAGDDETARFLTEVLQAYGPEAYRAVEAKLQIIWMLAEMLDDARVLVALQPFLVDHSDDVRWAVMDLLEQGTQRGLVDSHTLAGARADLAKLVTDDQVGPRIQRRAAEMLADHEWQVPAEAAGLTALLEEDFFLDKKRYVRRRSRAGSATGDRAR